MRFLRFVPYLCGCLAIWSVSDMDKPPVPEGMQFRFGDKVMHAGAYGLLGLLASVGFFSSSARSLFWGTLGLAAGYGAVDEIHQAFVPGRSSTVGDWVADAVGAGMAAAFVVWIRPRIRRRDPGSGSGGR